MYVITVTPYARCINVCDDVLEPFKTLFLYIIFKPTDIFLAFEVHILYLGLRPVWSTT